MESGDLKAILTQADNLTRVLRSGISKLRGTNVEEKRVKELEDKNLEWTNRHQEAKSRIEQHRSELTTNLEKAKTLVQQMSIHINDYRSKANTVRSRSFKHGQEFLNNSSQTIEEHARLLERHRAQLQTAINEAADLLHVHLDGSKDPNVPKRLDSTPHNLFLNAVIPSLGEIAVVGPIALKSAIGGFAIGGPQVAGALLGAMGLRLIINKAKEKSDDRLTSELPLPEVVSAPFFPT